MLNFNAHLDYLSRREFLQMSSMGALGLLIPRPQTKAARMFYPYGRVMDEQISAYPDPDFNSIPITKYRLDTILPIQAIVTAEAPAYNPDWFQIKPNEYIHSSQLQPVQVQLNETQAVNPYGQLAEVTIPFTDAHLKPDNSSKIAYRYYYQTTHWVNSIKTDAEGNRWYQVRDDKATGQVYYVRAEHLRVLPKYEIEPISPDLAMEDKRIIVHKNQHLVIAYEGDRPVFISKIAIGDEMTNPRWKTPTGQFKTYYKRPSRHMVAGNLAFGDYDLPGVPWVSFITEYGIAFHGTFWHNDFGRSRSHGCINLPSHGAKWLYRWTMPEVPYDRELKYIRGVGTRVEIV